MFDAEIDRQVDTVAKRLARELNRRFDAPVMADANFYLEFGQYDSFVTNVMANDILRRAKLTLDETRDARQLIDLLKLAPQIDDLRRDLARTGRAIPGKR